MTNFDFETEKYSRGKKSILFNTSPKFSDKIKLNWMMNKEKLKSGF